VVNTATVNTSTTTSQQGEEAGITLDIFPTINSENSVFLECGLEVSEFSQIETNNVLPPKTTNSITSSVTIAGDRIYVIGGLTRETKAKVVEKVPLLGDIPFLGKLFRTEGGSVSVTNLYIFLRAHILTDENFKDLANITDQALEKAAASSEKEPITSQFELPLKPLRVEAKTDRDAPAVFKRGTSEEPRLRQRVKEAQERYRGSGKDNNTGGAGESAALPPTPPRGVNREKGSAFEEPPAPKITRSKPVSLKTIPEAWKKRGLRVNPEGNSWFVPLRLDVR
jgi:hypothetical protein